MIAPPPPIGKPIAFFDTECFPNFWLLKLRVQNGPLFSFQLRSGESLAPDRVAVIQELFSIFRVVSFNGIYYDVSMIAAALIGFSCEQLKWLSDEIIVQEKKPWELGLNTEWKPFDHIDIMEVLPGAGSAKQYAARIHAKRIQDLPFSPERWLSESEMAEVDSYCELDLTNLEFKYTSLQPQLILRNKLSERYGIDLRSKSDAQVGEAIIRLQCERAVGHKLYKQEIDWNMAFRYEPPAFISFRHPQLLHALEVVKNSIFRLGANGRVQMPKELEDLQIQIGSTTYQMGIGGLHSHDGKRMFKSNETHILQDKDVRGYYPRLIINSGHWPPALGPAFRDIFRTLVEDRDVAKALAKSLKKSVGEDHFDFIQAFSESEGGKVATNGPFGKLGSYHSILFAPQMLIQTTITGQLSILMEIEWHEAESIPVISANTDGFVVYCPREKLPLSEAIMRRWEKVTGLEMETKDYAALYQRDVNNYFAVENSGGVKRKGKYSTAGLVEKKNPDVEICSDAVADFLEKGTPIRDTLAICRDIRKFLHVQQVNGGAVKLWGEGPRKNNMAVRDMAPTLESFGWVKKGHRWHHGDNVTDAATAFKTCFMPQRPQYLGKTVRWYYGTRSPGLIVYNNNGNTVSLSYGAQPCLELPDEFPNDIDYGWYMDNCNKILKDVGYAAV
jgi:hypothetical protein